MKKNKIHSKVDPSLLEQVDRISKVKGQTRSFLMQEALRKMVEDDYKFDEAFEDLLQLHDLCLEMTAILQLHPTDKTTELDSKFFDLQTELVEKYVNNK